MAKHSPRRDHPESPGPSGHTRLAPLGRALVWGLALLLLGACGGRDTERIHIYAAASLTDAVTELCAIWNAKPEVALEVLPVFASSSTLARQIREGAPARVFLSANQEWMDYLARKSDRLRSETRLDLLENQLVLVVPPGNPGGLAGIADLDGDIEGLALGDPAHVPAGQYAEAWLRRSGLWDQVEGELRPAKDVRAALAYVERGEVDAGLVYLTDARVGDVEVLALLDPELTPPIRYPLALLDAADGARNPELETELRSFHRWLLGSEASAVFHRHGFRTLSQEQAR